MRLPLLWRLVLGFGIIIVAIVIIHNYSLTRLDECYAAATTSVDCDARAIRAAQKLRSLLDTEQRYIRLFLAIPNTHYALLRSEAHRTSRIHSDSLALFIHADKERELLTSFRRTHEQTAAAIAAYPKGPAIKSGTITDSIALLQSRLDQIIRLNQQAIGQTLAGMDRDTTPFLDSSLWILLGGLAAAVAAAFVIARSITVPLSRLRSGAERITRGEYRRFSIHPDKEIGELQRAFNALSDRVRHTEQYKAEMAQQISRALQTPLQAMHAAYYTLAEQIAGPLNERQMNLVTTIRDNVDVVSAFSTQFLDLARIEAGMMRYHKRVVDILPLITPLINTARVAAAPKAVNISLAVQSVPALRVDPEKVTTVVTTLLNNAIRLTPRGGHVTVTITPCGTGARIAVKDTGYGIAAEDLPGVFARSFHTTDAPAADTRGTGMGLALVKAIVDGHGGKVYATSTEGGGSTFTVELPAETGHPLPHPTHAN